MQSWTPSHIRPRILGQTFLFLPKEKFGARDITVVGKTCLLLQRTSHRYLINIPFLIHNGDKYHCANSLIKPNSILSEPRLVGNLLLINQGMSQYFYL